MKPVLGQEIHYQYGFSHYAGKVIELYDDCYMVKGPHIGKRLVSYEDHFCKTSMFPTKIHLLYKDGEPVMKKKRFLRFKLLR